MLKQVTSCTCAYLLLLTAAAQPATEIIFFYRSIRDSGLVATNGANISTLPGYNYPLKNITPPGRECEGYETCFGY